MRILVPLGIYLLLDCGKLRLYATPRTVEWEGALAHVKGIIWSMLRIEPSMEAAKWKQIEYMSGHSVFRSFLYPLAVIRCGTAKRISSLSLSFLMWLNYGLILFSFCNRLVNCSNLIELSLLLIYPLCLFVVLKMVGQILSECREFVGRYELRWCHSYGLIHYINKGVRFFLLPYYII